MLLKKIFAAFLSFAVMMPCVQAASVREGLIDALCLVAKKGHRDALDATAWCAFLAALHEFTAKDWTFDRAPIGGDPESAAEYWDDIDEPLAEFLASQGMRINQKVFGLVFKKTVRESVLCRACNTLFTGLEELPSCKHVFCEMCILKHYTTPCLCDDCFADRNVSECVLKRAHLACPACNVFMGSDFICCLKQKPDYPSFMFKLIGRKHRVAAAIKRRNTV